METDMLMTTSQRSVWYVYKLLENHQKRDLEQILPRSPQKRSIVQNPDLEVLAP